MQYLASNLVFSDECSHVLVFTYYLAKCIPATFKRHQLDYFLAENLAGIIVYL